MCWKYFHRVMVGEQIIGFALSPLIYSVADIPGWWYNHDNAANDDGGKYDGDNDDVWML